MNNLKSEQVVISAPLSFNGSALRIWKITKIQAPIAKPLLVVVALGLIGFAWMLVAFWYVIMYGLFGLLFIPYRLIRRSGRKQKRDKLRHRELLEAIDQSKR